jgi:hypothetical protein
MTSNDILDLNNLMYLPDTNASVAVARTQRTFYPEKSSYRERERISITIDGNQFLDFKNSSLRFLFKPLNGTISKFGDFASATNFFSRVRVVSKDGIVFTDLLRANLFSHLESLLKDSKLYREVVGLSYGYNSSFTSTLNPTYEYTIPMRMLSPLFNCSQLLPPQLSDGMTIEFFLEDPTVAFDLLSEPGVFITVYEINNVELLVDASLVQDNTRNEVENMGFGASDDLVYEFTDVVNSQSFAPLGSDDIYFEAPHSLSNALEAITVLRKQNNVLNPNASSMDTVGPFSNNLKLNTDYKNQDLMSYSLGSNKFPEQPVLGAARIYQQILYSQGVLQSRTCNQFNVELLNTHVRYGMYPVNLRTSKLFDNSGRTVSNAQRLSVSLRRYEIDEASKNYILDMFIYYTARIVVKNGKMSIEI